MIIDTFIENSKKNPELEAIVYNGKSYSYSKLNEMVLNYSSFFQNELNIQKNQCVALWFVPSVELIATILGLYYIGAYYLPIHDDFTIERKKFLIDESDKEYVLTNFDVSTKEIDYINVKNGKASNAVCKIDGTFAYRIYTSGSTGDPKGVQITQKNLNYILYNLDALFPCVEGDSQILKTPFSFDVSIVELFGWIMRKARLVIPSSDKKRMFSTLANDIIENQVTHLTMSPTMISAFIPLVSVDTLKKMDESLKYILLASEELPVNLANRLLDIFPTCKIINAYGPTETTVYCTAYIVDKKLDNRVPIGIPFYGVETYLKFHDDFDFPELLIAGDCCSPGYWKNDKKNIESFVQINGKRYYRTGDLVEKLEDDNLVYRGRVDNQIQINGIRTEIGEIEYLISKVSVIKHVAVVYTEKKLLCFYSTKIPVCNNKMRLMLQKALPSFMMPNFMYKTEEFPTTINGKIDKRKLVENIIENNTNLIEYQKSEPKSSLEKIKGLFAELFNLPVDSIKNNTNFFSDLGGDSLNQMVLLTELESIFNQEFSLNYLSMYPTPIDIYNQLFKNEEGIDFDFEELVEYVLDNQIKQSSNYISESMESVEISRYQSNYIKNDFNEILSILVPINSTDTLQTLKRNLGYILKKSDALSSVIDSEGNLLLLNKQFDFVDFYIPMVALIGKNNGFISIKERIDLVVKSHIVKNKFKNMLFRAFFVNYSNKLYLYVAVSHFICDLGSIKLLENLLLSPSPKISGSFLDFITFIKTNSNIENFKKINKGNFLDLFPKTKKIKSDVKDRLIVSDLGDLKLEGKTMEELIFEANFLLSNFLKYFVLDDSNIVISTLLSIKEYSNGKKFNTIGDFHSSFAFMYVNGENFDSYMSRCLEILSVLKNGNQLQVAIENGNDSEFNNKFRGSQNVKTDFLGVAHNSELNLIYSEALQFKKDFYSWVKGDRVRTNLFIYEKKLYAIWLNEPVGLVKHLVKNNVQFYDIANENWSLED